MSKLTLSSTELAAILGVSEKTVRRAAIDGDIPPHCYQKKPGGRSHYRFLKAAVQYYAENLAWPPTKRAMASYARNLMLAENTRLKAALQQVENVAV